MARVLIAYLVANSGHHAAARAVEESFRAVDPDGQTLVVDLLSFMHPRISQMVERTYLYTIRRTPELWGTLYDSKWLDVLTRKMRRLVHRGNNRKVLNLMNSFRPDIAICTQAHALSVLAAHSAAHQPHLQLWGVVTDYVPHRFWAVDGTSRYVVPRSVAAEKLESLGVDRGRIHVLGIPVSERFVRCDPPAETRRPRVLVMGGSRGLGVRFRTLRWLDRVPATFSIDLVAGTNRNLRAQVVRHRPRFAHPVRVRGFVRDMAPLMRQASLLISKPGGLTCAEAMSVGLPMALVRPIPGQEQATADALVRAGAAVQIERDRDMVPVVASLFQKPDLLEMMRWRAAELGRPQASSDLARCVLDHCRE